MENEDLGMEVEESTDQEDNNIEETQPEEYSQGEDEDFLAMLDSALAEIEQEAFQEAQANQQEEEPTEPVFGGSDEDSISLEEIEQLEQSFTEMEEVVKEAKASEEEALAQIEDLSAAIEERDEAIQLMEDAWSKVESHPILGKWVRDIVLGNEVNIPEAIHQLALQEIEDLPDLDDAQGVGQVQKPITLSDIFKDTPDWIT